MANKILYADFDPCKRKTAIVPQSWQWDKGQRLRITGLDIPNGTQVHFIVDDTTVTEIAGVIDGVARVAVPDAVFLEEGTVQVYIYLSEDDSTAETLYTAILTVRGRPQPEDYSDPTEEQESMFQEAIDAVGVRAEEASGYADDASGYATLAKSWAVGGTGTREWENIDNAKFYAERAAMGADKTGWLWSEFNQETGILRIVVSEDLADEMLFNVDYSTGRLEIEII